MHFPICPSSTSLVLSCSIHVSFVVDSGLEQVQNCEYACVWQAFFENTMNACTHTQIAHTHRVRTHNGGNMIIKVMLKEHSAS